MQQILARLRGRSDTLLCYDDIRQQLRAGPVVERGLQEIPLDKIVGSVGRSDDFTRSFLPKKDSDQERWARVKSAITELKGMPPIEVYQVGDAYFVIDGNHRVSVARQLGSDTISAHVTEVKTRVPLTADDDPSQMITKARYADFLEQTNLDQLYPDANLMMTFGGQYKILLKQIESECRLLSDSDDGRCLEENWTEAVRQWYEKVYLPVIQIIRELGVIYRFPERTEADIYVLLSEQREELEEALGWRLSPEEAIPALIEQRSSRPLLSRLLDSVAPALDDEPATGRWREQQLALQRENHLFAKILILFEGIEDDWELLEQIVGIGEPDNDHILGLYVARDRQDAEREAVQQMRERFNARCEEAGLAGEFAVEIGRVDKIIIRRAAWVDLVVINLTNPPEIHPLARMRSSWGTIIQQCPRPILAVPNAVSSDHSRILLAYDGSLKANEALFVATYLAVRWRRELTVMTVPTQNTKASSIEQAQAYLEQYGVTWAKYVVREEPIHKAIIDTAAEFDSNLLIVGGFGRQPALRLVLGSTVEHLLREFEQPMLICR